MTAVVRQASRGIIIILIVGIIVAGMFESVKRQKMTIEIERLSELAQHSAFINCEEIEAELVEGVEKRVEGLEGRVANLETAARVAP